MALWKVVRGSAQRWIVRSSSFSLKFSFFFIILSLKPACVYFNECQVDSFSHQRNEETDASSDVIVLLMVILMTCQELGDTESKTKLDTRLAIHCTRRSLAHTMMRFLKMRR